MTLSTALWRPTSSRTTTTVPSGSKGAAACTAPVAANSSWAPRTRSGMAASSSSPNAIAPVAGSGASRSHSSSIEAEPHSPHDEVVVPSRGVGTGARPPVSTDTTLNLVSTAEPVPQ
jgi:hypothetical protein